jgi:hypothetical protein
VNYRGTAERRPSPEKARRRGKRGSAPRNARRLSRGGHGAGPSSRRPNHSSHKGRPSHNRYTTGRHTSTNRGRSSRRRTNNSRRHRGNSIELSAKAMAVPRKTECLPHDRRRPLRRCWRKAATPAPKAQECAKSARQDLSSAKGKTALANGAGEIEKQHLSLQLDARRQIVLTTGNPNRSTAALIRVKAHFFLRRSRNAFAQPALSSCRPRATASASASTGFVITEPVAI